MSLRTNPFNEEQLMTLNKLLPGLTKEQILWLSGYLEGRLAIERGEEVQQNLNVAQPESSINLTIIYGSETGHSHGLAEKLAEKAANKNISAKVLSMYDFNYEKLKEEENIAIIVSTHGEGEPPDMAEDFYKYVNESHVPQLENLNYSVLALGDKTYKYFCKTGEDIHASLKKMGAFPVVPLVKCDVDYDKDADIWMNNFLVNLTALKMATSPESAGVGNMQSETNSFAEFSKTNPYMATVLDKIKITGNESDKEVYHVELSLEGSGLEYEPGDSVGIFTKNPEALVAQILKNTGFNPEQIVDVNEEEYSIKDALTYHLEITILTFDLLRKFHEKTQNPELLKIINDDKLSDDYLYGHDVLDLLEDFPFEWNANKLVQVLRPIPPRLYSISSSMESVGEEVHATVSVVRYERKNRLRNGSCSSYLADVIEIDEQIPVYIERNPSFKLPTNGSKIIMVGAGTGVAPYRAFMQHRESLGIKGESWLFFGDQRFDSDFLYKKEWHELMESQHLTKMDVAFSRDQEKKNYVQHKLKENQKEVFEWIENGAHFYLCGDMKYMAKDVNKTLLDIIQAQGGISEEQAAKYVKNLKREKRFHSDVY
jgi:sulfite reductase (NADPH) flavoprotein alpha-component